MAAHASPDAGSPPAQENEATEENKTDDDEFMATPKPSAVPRAVGKPMRDEIDEGAAQGEMSLAHGLCRRKGRYHRGGEAFPTQKNSERLSHAALLRAQRPSAFLKQRVSSDYHDKITTAETLQHMADGLMDIKPRHILGWFRKARAHEDKWLKHLQGKEAKEAQRAQEALKKAQEAQKEQ